MLKTGRNRSRRNLSISAGAKNNGGGAGCLIPFGLVFGGMGLFAFILFAKSFIGDVKTRSWEETPAELIKCEIIAEQSRNEDPFRIDVEYRYNYEGQSHTSNQYMLGDGWSDDYEKLALKRSSYRNGDGAVICYVNPGNPSEAIMKLKSLWEGLFLLIPLVFVIVGGALVWGGIASLRKKKSLKAGKPESISAKARSGKGGKAVGMIVCFIFFAVGLGILFPLGILPLKRSIEAREWVESPCKIIWSRVQSHDSDDGTTYSVDIFYEYEFEGDVHRSNRYKFMGGSSSGRRAKAEVVRRYPKGSTQICYVDPARPERAVIERSRSSIGFWFLLPLVFMLVGAGGVIGILSGGRRKKAQNDIRSLAFGSSDTNGAEAAPAPNAASKTFNPARSRKMAVIGLALAALFWNGIVSVFLFSTIGDLKSGGIGFFSLFPILFLIPFLLVGLVIIIAFFHQLLGLFNPRIKITLAPGEPRLGDTVRLSWKLSGSSTRLRSLKILLIGTESATYQRGTNTHTATEEFYVRSLLDETNTLSFYQGDLEFEVPFDLMYSMTTGNNAIQWSLNIRGEIKPGPDISDDCRIEIFPVES